MEPYARETPVTFSVKGGSRDLLWLIGFHAPHPVATFQPLGGGVYEPSGRWLLSQGSGAYLLDADDLSVVSHLDHGVDYHPDGFSSDAAHAYVWTFRDSMNIMGDPLSQRPSRWAHRRTAAMRY
ncbi:MAG TPA: hypothetical protein VE569_06720 [Acidimicrobiia bacterium]|nr:hypothetical protein [Acidimicrobiia bacterium]